MRVAIKFAFDKICRDSDALVDHSGYAEISVGLSATCTIAHDYGGFARPYAVVVSRGRLHHLIAESELSPRVARVSLCNRLGRDQAECTVCSQKLERSTKEMCDKIGIAMRRRS